MADIPAINGWRGATPVARQPRPGVYRTATAGVLGAVVAVNAAVIV